MKKTIKIYLFLSIIFLVSACSSPLEDIEINDFNLIRAKYNIRKELSSNGQVYDKIEVVIEDKNFINFELKGATITVNDVEMYYDNSFVGKRYLSNLPVLFNEKYEFKIRLANADIITTSIFTPKNNYKSISYPKEITLGKDYTIKWKKQKNIVKIHFVLNDMSKEEGADYFLNKTMDRDRGRFVISGKETKKYVGTSECYFTLTYSKEFEIPDKLRGGGATVDFIYNARDININK